MEPLLFFTNYRHEAQTFYGSDTHQYDYGPGFGVTVGASISLLISGGLGAALFCGMVRSFVKQYMKPQVSFKALNEKDKPV